MALNLHPRDGQIWNVRWVRNDGKLVKHRTFGRRHDAERFHTKLVALGKLSALYVTDTSWTEIER